MESRWSFLPAIYLLNYLRFVGIPEVTQVVGVVGECHIKVVVTQVRTRPWQNFFQPPVQGFFLLDFNFRYVIKMLPPDFLFILIPKIIFRNLSKIPTTKHLANPSQNLLGFLESTHLTTAFKKASMGLICIRLSPRSRRKQNECLGKSWVEQRPGPRLYLP